MISEVEQTMNNDTQEQTINEKVIREFVETENHNVNVTQRHEEIIRCFVCDSKVQGRRYALATCKTHGSRARVIEKLGELVGERYVVVINEDDVICRSCANLINNLDRLESEMKRSKAAVLRFLECKYGLAKGELLDGANAPKLGQPPRIARCRSQGGDCNSDRRSFATVDDANGVVKKKKKSVWMQCDKCRYTTLDNNLMVRREVGRETQKSHGDMRDDQLSRSRPIDRWCGDSGGADVSNEATNEAKEPQPIQTAPLETIDLTGTVDDIDAIGNLPILTIQPDLKTIAGSVKDEQIELINLTNANSLQFQNFIPNEGSFADGQPILMRVLQQLGVTDDLNQLPMQHGIPVINGETGMVVTTTDNTAKQMLTMAEDGSLEMVAVDWNDVNPSEPDTHIDF